MAETNNYISQYSGDQLDAAIAVLGSLGAMFISPEKFDEFKKEFEKEMEALSSSVTTAMGRADAAIMAANTATAKAESTTGAAATATEEAKIATARANATIDKFAEIASQHPMIYEVIE